MTKEQFENKYVGKAVHCDTEEKAIEFLALASEFGWTWCLGSSLDNTNWEYGKDGTCYRVRENHVITYDSVKYYKAIEIEIIEFESEKKKVKKTKKVFDLGLFVDGMRKQKISNEKIMPSIQQWALKCHGFTKEETSNWQIHNSWLKEVEVDVELSEKEIESLKALKVLGFEWIARDKNNDLYAYDYNPPKIDSYHGKTDNNIRLEENLFSFISWEDEEPTNVDELLKHA